MEIAHSPQSAGRPCRFNELQKSLEGISQKVLTDSLRSMEADGIVKGLYMPKSRQS
ncbi:MAG: winged helix-turn-helix transcriptional regulator [Anaerovoracaceae bacterium]